MSNEDRNYVNKPFMLNLDLPIEKEVYEWLGKQPSKRFKHETLDYWIKQMRKEKGEPIQLSNKDEIISALNGIVLCDDCLSDKTDIKPRQAVNQYCRRMPGVIRRHTDKPCADCKNMNRSTKIVNELIG